MTPYAETLLVSLLAEQRRTNELLERLLAERAQSHLFGWPAFPSRTGEPVNPCVRPGNVWDSPTTHVSPTGTVRSGWTTPPPSYMHGHYLYDRPSMVGP